ALASIHTDDCAIVKPDIGDWAILDDMYAQFIGRPGKTPGDGIMAGDAGAALEGTAQYRVAAVKIDVGDEFLHLRRRQPFPVDTVVAVGIDSPMCVTDFLQVVRQIDYAALAEHDVVVQIL